MESSNLSEFGIETKRFDEFDASYDFLTELFNKEDLKSSESILRAKHLNNARMALANEMRESLVKLRTLKDEAAREMELPF
jgi:hypothetical protein